MTTEQCWIGLDVGELQTSICILDEAGPLLEAAAQSTPNEIAHVLKGVAPRRIASIVVEAGTNAALSWGLASLGYHVTAVDAAKAQRFLSIRRNKTDTNDARGLAEIAKLGELPRLTVHAKSPPGQGLRSQIVLRSLIVRQRTAAFNALRSLLVLNGAIARSLPSGKALRSTVQERVKENLVWINSDTEEQIDRLVGLCEALNEYEYWSLRNITSLTEANHVTKRFIQIPGVGPVCALSFYTAVEEPTRFARSADIGSYLGLVPRVKQSGTISQHSSITKAGNALTRSHLVMSAGVLLSRARKDCALRDWGLALVDTIGRPKARVAVARKLAVIMLAIWKSGEEFRPFPEKRSVLPMEEADADPVHMSGASTPHQEPGLRLPI